MAGSQCTSSSQHLSRPSCDKRGLISRVGRSEWTFAFACPLLPLSPLGPIPSPFSLSRRGHPTSRFHSGQWGKEERPIRPLKRKMQKCKTRRDYANLIEQLFSELQSPIKVFVRGLDNSVSAVSYFFCLNLPAAFSQPRTKTFFGLCTCLSCNTP